MAIELDRFVPPYLQIFSGKETGFVWASIGVISMQFIL